MQKVARPVLLAGGGLALLAGLDGGLLLVGVPAPVSADRLAQVHGVLLVLGFVGTLVALERAVALRRTPGWLAPGLLAAAAVALVAPGVPLDVARVLLPAGATALLGVAVALRRRGPGLALSLEVLGATLGLGAALLWSAGVPVPTTVPWLAGFLVLTIAGERFELARLGAPAGADRAGAVAGTAVTAGVVATTLWTGAGHVLLGTALLGLVAVLVRHDVARRTIRSTGLPRYVAACLLAGYAWLTVAGVAWLAGGALLEGPAYDAVVHAVFLGFTLTMVMAHAPVILPAVLRTPLPYHPVLAAPVVLLQASLALRVLGGDLHGLTWALRVGGAANVVAVLLFLVLAVGSVVRGRRDRRGRPHRPPAAPGTTTPEDLARATAAGQPATTPAGAHA
ncbi:hypothetical protein Q9R32_01675 [Actinotalea sp. AC32]|nr:hypothetical protein [Actinotalea sp. AC32]